MYDSSVLYDSSALTSVFDLCYDKNAKTLGEEDENITLQITRRGMQEQKTYGGGKNNMKRRKSVVLAALLIVLCMIATGCSQKVTVKSLFENANKNSKKMDSVDMDIIMDMECKIEAAGASTTMGMNFDINAKAENEKGVYIDGEASINMMGSDMSVPVKAYTVMGKDENTVYTYDPTTEKWLYDTTDAQNMNMNIAAEDYSKMYEQLTLAEETEEYNKKECYKVSGEIKGSDISSVMEKLETEFKDTGIDADAMEELTLKADFYFDKEKKDLVGVKFDFSDSDWDKILKSASSELEESIGSETSMTMSEFTMEIKLNAGSDYKFKLPSDVKEEAVKSDEAAEELLELEE